MMRRAASSAEQSAGAFSVDDSQGSNLDCYTHASAVGCGHVEVYHGSEISMNFYRDHIYTHLVDMLGNPPPIRKVRQEIVSKAQGRVLEIGVGSGANFIYYDPARVTKLYALEPNAGMIRLAEKQRRQTTLNVEYLDLPGERIPLADGTVDTVVTTFTLCTIAAVTDAIQEFARALRPAGMLIFFELGLAPDINVQRWQMRLEAIHNWLFQG